MDIFRGVLDTGWVEYLQVMKGKFMDGKNVSRFKGKLFQIIKDAGRKFDDYSISPTIKQILLHWGYELTEKYFFY